MSEEMVPRKLFETADAAAHKAEGDYRAMRDQCARLARKLEAVRFVAEHWRDAAMTWELGAVASHPLAMVLAALDDETDPVELGLTADVHEAFRALTETHA